MKRLAAIALFGAGLAIGYVASAAVPASSIANRAGPASECPWPAQLDAVKAAPGN